MWSLLMHYVGLIDFVIDVPWFQGTFNAFSFRLMCVSSHFVEVLICSYLCFEGKFSKTKMQKETEIYC